MSRKTAARPMAQHGWRSRVVRRDKATINSRHPLPVADNVLAQQFVATRPHQVWMAAVTDGPTDQDGCMGRAARTSTRARSWAGRRAPG